MCTGTKRNRSARSLIFNNRGVVTRGKIVLTRKGHFRGNVMYDRVSIRELGSREEELAACRPTSSDSRVGIDFRLGIRRAGLAEGCSRCPFMPSQGRRESVHYSRVLGVRTVKLGGHVSRVRYRGTAIKLSKNLSSALTLLIVTETFSLSNTSEGSVRYVAVPYFKAASEACRGTYGLDRYLNTALDRVGVGRTMGVRFESVTRSPSIRSIACRGDRTEREARVLVSDTGRSNSVLIKAKSLSRLTLK